MLTADSYDSSMLQVEGLLDFVYDTQMEYAACTEETGSCVVMDGNDDMVMSTLSLFQICWCLKPLGADAH